MFKWLRNPFTPDPLVPPINPTAGYPDCSRCVRMADMIRRMPPKFTVRPLMVANLRRHIDIEHAN